LRHNCNFTHQQALFTHQRAFAGMFKYSSSLRAATTQTKAMCSSNSPQSV